MKKVFLLFLFSILVAHITVAQKLTASVSTNKVAVGQTFQLSYTINSNGSNFKAPDLSGFDVYSGPNQSTSMSIVNGAMSQSITLSYILSPKKEGKLTIAPASITVGGSAIQSNSVTIEVVKGAPQTPQQGNNPQQSGSETSSDNVGDNLFIKASVNKTKVTQGEEISVTYKVYTRYQMRGFQDIKFPDCAGFWTQDVPQNNQQIQVSTENIDGVNYNVAELKHTFLFPQRSGKLTIEPMTAEVIVRKQSNRRSRDIWDQFFGGGFEDATYSVKSKPISIDVSPLPQNNKPQNFSGAVGDFSIKAEISKDKVKANDAINLVITLNGKGNIKLVDPPKINFPDDFETYDPKIKENIGVTAAGVSGNKTFDYTIIPRHEGDFTISGIDFSYYDSGKKQYVTVPSPEFKIHVDKGKDDGGAASVFTPHTKEDVKELGRDIRYIKTKNIHLTRPNDYFFGSLLFYLLLVSPFVLFILFIIIRRKRIEQNKDAVAVKSRKATRMARKRLAAAEQHLKSSDKNKFYAEIFKALYGYLSDKLNLPVADLNKEHITEKLTSRNVSTDTIVKLITTLDNCEYAHYAPTAAMDNLKENYESTVSLITKIENEIR